MRYLFAFVSFIIISKSSLAQRQHPMEVDSTGNVVYYAEFKIDSDEVDHADRVFSGFINANFKNQGNPIMFKNLATHRMTAKCYFPMTMLNKLLASAPAEGYCYFTWAYSINDRTVKIYLYGIYFTADTGGSFAQQVASAEWMNDNFTEFTGANKAADKINDQLKHYIKLFKDSLKR